MNLSIGNPNFQFNLLRWMGRKKVVHEDVWTSVYPEHFYCIVLAVKLSLQIETILLPVYSSCSLTVQPFYEIKLFDLISVEVSF